jgi:hypothetical protein
MPPVVICIIGAIGAVAAYKWVAREARRINAELHPERYNAAEGAGQAEPIVRLRRDADGVYRPG